MQIADLFLTPFYLLLIYGLAYAVQPSVTNRYTKPYFIPALTLKLVGGLAFGIIFNTLYGGDTNQYYKLTGIVHEAFGDSFTTGLRLLFIKNREADPSLFHYTDRMFWLGRDSTEYLPIQVGAVLGLFCFNNYSVITVGFATLSFTGMWAMYVTFVKLRPQIYKELAVAVFFIPSVFFWGSGLMKDPLCLGALGWIFYAFYRGFIERKNIPRCILIGYIAGSILVSTKIYILLAFLPPALLWVFNEYNARMSSPVLRAVAKPVLLTVGAVIGLVALNSLSKLDSRFDVDKIGAQSKLTADYLLSVSQTEHGSGYSLGEQDGTIGGMLKLAPQAIVVSLFRPFIWEAHNPTMLLSAIEASYFLFLTLRIFYRVGIAKTLKAISSSPAITLCFVFSIIFAIAVGVSSGNFGTLVRYKIPLMPFYLGGLYILQSISMPSKQPAKAIAARRQLQGS
jgi:hypothetical protein